MWLLLVITLIEGDIYCHMDFNWKMINQYKIQRQVQIVVAMQFREINEHYYNNILNYKSSSVNSKWVLVYLKVYD